MSSQLTSLLNTSIRVMAKLSLLIIVILLTSGRQALAAPAENLPIWRIQIYFQTYDTPNAGSDDSVKVELREGNATWVDSPLDDWERGQERIYDLRLEAISRVSDIDFLRVSKNGSDGWCIGRIQLRVNGVALYDEQFPFGHWLDNEDGHLRTYFIDDYFMRMRGEWSNYVAPTRPDVVPVGSMRSRIQCLFGDFLTAGDDLGFRNSNPIGIWTLDANTWRVSVDLDDKKLFVPDPDVDVDFDLTVVWNGNFTVVRPDFRVENLNVSYTWPAYGAPARYFMELNFRPRLNEMMKNFAYRLGTGIQLATNGDLHFLPIVINPPPIEFEAATTEEQSGAMPGVESPDRKRVPLGLRVKTGGEFQAGAERAFTATVRSGLAEDAEVDVSFTLPAQVILSNPAIKVNDGEGTRWLAPQVAVQDDGTTLITVRDRVAAGKETAYGLGLIFEQADDQAARINTRVVPATAAMAEQVAPLEAATTFRWQAGVINPQGTTIHSSRFIKDGEPREATPSKRKGN